MHYRDRHYEASLKAYKALTQFHLNVNQWLTILNGIPKMFEHILSPIILAQLANEPYCMQQQSDLENLPLKNILETRHSLYANSFKRVFSDGANGKFNGLNTYAIYTRQKNPEHHYMPCNIDTLSKLAIYRRPWPYPHKGSILQACADFQPPNKNSIWYCLYLPAATLAFVFLPVTAALVLSTIFVSSLLALAHAFTRSITRAPISIERQRQLIHRLSADAFTEGTKQDIISTIVRMVSSPKSQASRRLMSILKYPFDDSSVITLEERWNAIKMYMLDYRNSALHNNGKRTFIILEQLITMSPSSEFLEENEIISPHNHDPYKRPISSHPVKEKIEAEEEDEGQQPLMTVS